MANSATTEQTREDFAKAHGGDQPLPKITQVAWGNGGHDPDTREPIAVDGTETTVPGELLKKDIDNYSYPVTTTLRLAVSLLSGELNGYEISACGLYDENGNLAAVKTFTPKTKDQETEIYINWDEEF